MTNARSSDAADHARLVALAREVIEMVRANGHHVVVSAHGGFNFQLNVSKPQRECPKVKGQGLIAFALGVDLLPYIGLFEVPNWKKIFVEVLTEGSP